VRNSIPTPASPRSILIPKTSLVLCTCRGHHFRMNMVNTNKSYRFDASMPQHPIGSAVTRCDPRHQGPTLHPVRPLDGDWNRIVADLQCVRTPPCPTTDGHHRFAIVVTLVCHAKNFD
jgi:hypothetical protein